jgi:hypothetical protein
MGCQVMKIQMLIVADAANLDVATGKINILGAFTRIFAKQFPAVHPRMAIVVKLAADTPIETTDVRDFEGILTDADGHEVALVSGPVSIPRGEKGTRPDASIILELNGVGFTHAGFYKFTVYVDGDEIGDTSIELVQVEQ